MSRWTACPRFAGQVAAGPRAAIDGPGDRRGPQRGARAALVRQRLAEPRTGFCTDPSRNSPSENDVGFRVIVDGQPRPLHPVLRDEVYRIGREALVNAFRHSGRRASKSSWNMPPASCAFWCATMAAASILNCCSRAATDTGASRHARARRENRRETSCLEQPRRRHRGGTVRPQPLAFNLSLAARRMVFPVHSGRSENGLQHPRTRRPQHGRR